jgi:cytochrome c biogenesis protein CcmG/thiol:disulfide interchange protein DsbE
VIGVSLDDDGWNVVKSFLADTKVPYEILLGDQTIAKGFGIGAIPDTFIIDRKGRIAAAYRGLVDKDDVEKNIQAILAKE